MIAPMLPTWDISLNARVRNNNDNDNDNDNDDDDDDHDHDHSNNANPIWRGSVLQVEEPQPPLWRVESCSLPSRWPNFIPAFPPFVVRTPHLHGAPTTEETSKVKL